MRERLIDKDTEVYAPLLRFQPPQSDLPVVQCTLIYGPYGEKSSPSRQTSREVHIPSVINTGAFLLPGSCSDMVATYLLLLSESLFRYKV